MLVIALQGQNFKTKTVCKLNVIKDVWKIEFYTKKQNDIPYCTISQK